VLTKLVGVMRARVERPQLPHLAAVQDLVDGEELVVLVLAQAQASLSSFR
jgi:hypothetical protein